MTPGNARRHPELFLHDACLPPELLPRIGDWMQTFPTGTMFWPLDPRQHEVHLEDIAHALSNICRFGGHCREFLSVAQHSIIVSQVCDPADALVGLLHDAPEAYLGDLIRPLKYGGFGERYRKVEHSLLLAILGRFGLPVRARLPASVERADAVVLWTEKRDLLTEPPAPWGEPQGHGPICCLPGKVEPWSPEEARRQFLLRFKMLTEK